MSYVDQVLDGLEFNTARQRELMRIILEAFAEYRRREQHFYKLQGMSTSHIVVHAIQDFATLRAFWPKDLVSTSGTGGQLYALEEDTLYKVQNAVRDSVKQLMERGYMEKLGNEDERRWRPVKMLDGVTL